MLSCYDKTNIVKNSSENNIGRSKGNCYPINICIELKYYNENIEYCIR